MLPKGLLKEYSRTITLLSRCTDMIAVGLAGVIAFYVKFEGLGIPSLYIMAIAMGVFLTPLVFPFFDIYSSVRGKGLASHIFDLVQAVCILFVLMAGIAFIAKLGEVYSRAWFGIWMGTVIVSLILYRCTLFLLLRFMRRRGLNERRVVIFGAGKLGVRFAEAVQQALWTGFRIVAFMDDHAEHKAPVINTIPVIQTPEKLNAYLQEHQVDELWLALPLKAESRVKEVLHTLRHQTITTRFVLDIFGLDLLNHSITDLAGFPVLNICSSPMMGVNRMIKAVEDRVIAALILLFISPFLLLIALALKCTSRGPVLFKQQRLGWDGRIITIYKFRTMKQHREKAGVVTQATVDDKRVTGFGKFLRKTSLDELPQFINVLQGRMSIVGPRPHALAHNDLYKESIHTYMQRHRVKPGITGWAQVNGWRGETDTLQKMQKRVEFDLYYINNWSLGFDLKIIILTFFRGFISRNAY
jgi:putative colanic acid biosynthesis UDP-glucose lipid carrier transferase